MNWRPGLALALLLTSLSLAASPAADARSDAGHLSRFMLLQSDDLGGDGAPGFVGDRRTITSEVVRFTSVYANPAVDAAHESAVHPGES